MARKSATSSSAKSKARPARRSVAKAETVYKLKIVLKHIKPDVWRRIELPDCTLEDLHEVIQACMPWGNCHLWEFSVGQQRFGMEPEDDWFMMDDDSDPAWEVQLSDLAAAGVKKFSYMYDFGDSWDHVITFEKPVARDPKAKYPRCVAGARACPPDDCGGPWGYAALLQVLADPKHPEHKHMMEWAGGPIDPEAFDLDAINKRLQRLKFK